LNEGLAAFTANEFDYVVLSQTLPAVYDVQGLITEMLRVGRSCIVSFPNLAYRKLRQRLAEEGRAPRGLGWVKNNWFDTPEIRFLSISDFEDFCAQEGITIQRRVALDTEAGSETFSDPNLNSDLAIFVISRTSRR
jgi:methionine biosynthesis protein MetW